MIRRPFDKLRNLRFDGYGCLSLSKAPIQKKNNQ